MAEEKKEEVLNEDPLNENAPDDDAQKGMYMTFQTGKEFFGISITYVNEIIGMQEITAVPEVEDYIKGLINLRGKIIPVIDVRARFKMEPKEYNDRSCIIVIDVKEMSIGLIVERIAEVDTIKDDDIMPPPSFGNRGQEHNKYVYGLARTGDTMKLLLDPEKLVKDDDLEALEEMQEEE